MPEANQLGAIEGCIFEEDKDLTSYSTMKLVARGPLLTVQSLSGLERALGILKEYRLLGLGANQILPERTETVYVKLDFPFDKSYLNEVRERYVLPASVPLHLLSVHAVRFGLKGWEVFTGIPATLGGAVYMNAGTRLGEIGPLVEHLEVMTPSGKIREIRPDDRHFSYRENFFLRPGEVIVQVTLRHFGVDREVSGKIRAYLDHRTKTQPLKENTCGCIFKNYHYPPKKGGRTCRVGEFLDIMGLKGFRLGDVSVDGKHGNFMVNGGGAGAGELKRLMEIVKDELVLHCGLNFEYEVECPWE